jgi:hypothetical protein
MLPCRGSGPLASSSKNSTLTATVDSIVGETTILSCLLSFLLQVSAASGRHSYGGWSVVNDYLVVDMTNMTEVRPLGARLADSLLLLCCSLA